MASKRPPSPDLIQNPFIKKRNLTWALELHDSESVVSENEQPPHDSIQPPNLTALESGTAAAHDPASHFFSRLSECVLDPFPSATARYTPAELRALFEEHAGSKRGSHFVIHQHDHPVAGPHYDLRLQVNETSSLSWALMYGLPGDANSRRLNRNAMETRVHCLWNHVVEVGGWRTGSLVVWDCGWFEVLGGGKKGGDGPGVDPESEKEGSGEEESEGEGEDETMTEQEKLARAFRERKIRVRLHGRKLPRNYVVYLRLTKGEDAEGRRKGRRAMERGVRRRGRAKKVEATEETSNEEDSDGEVDDAVVDTGENDDEKELTEVEKEVREVEDEHVRRTNAYKGALNSVGSVYQRRWYLSLDREASGFTRRVVNGKRTWALQKEGDESEVDGARLKFPFYVRGPEVERSVVTGRLGREVLKDEGVDGYVGRKGWKPVLN
ncbi:hypothetical protein CTRI78_v002320 [Colletotrichum trifolii]|uniref:DNA ligase D 3'-phosphoesterase domain-containing protein n=1 Tax=Colletotrichum trifolii TaxID=5466 RepID=A0A4R8RM63_COLTR|nr:hypothetical protein CTRI78_v002320 [Colletotrichum trifolii]